MPGATVLRLTASKAILVALALLAACSVEPKSTAVSEGSSGIGVGSQVGSETTLAPDNTVPGVSAETPVNSPAAARSDNRPGNATTASSPTGGSAAGVTAEPITISGRA